jgi:hypothetical protein
MDVMTLDDWKAIPQVWETKPYVFDEPSSIEEAQDRIDQTTKWWVAVEQKLDKINMDYRSSEPPDDVRGFRAVRVANLAWCRFELNRLFLWLLQQESPISLAVLNLMNAVDRTPNIDPLDLEEWKALEQFVPNPLTNRERKRPGRTRRII